MSEYAPAWFFILTAPLQAGYSQPDPEVAVTVGQDTLEKTDSTTYSALAQVRKDTTRMGYWRAFSFQ